MNCALTTSNLQLHLTKSPICASWHLPSRSTLFLAEDIWINHNLSEILQCQKHAKCPSTTNTKDYCDTFWFQKLRTLAIPAKRVNLSYHWNFIKNYANPEKNSLQWFEPPHLQTMLWVGTQPPRVTTTQTWYSIWAYWVFPVRNTFNSVVSSSASAAFVAANQLSPIVPNLGEEIEISGRWSGPIPLAAKPQNVDFVSNESGKHHQVPKKTIAPARDPKQFGGI